MPSNLNINHHIQLLQTAHANYWSTLDRSRLWRINSPRSEQTLFTRDFNKQQYLYNPGDGATPREERTGKQEAGRRQLSR